MRTLLIISPLGLCLCEIASAASPPVAGRRVQQVEIVLSDFAFTPQNVRFHHGQMCEIVLANKVSGGHDLSAHESFAAARAAQSDPAVVSYRKSKSVGEKPARCGPFQMQDITAKPARPSCTSASV
jgi:hypothetical protein